MWRLALLPQSKNPTISRYSGFVLAFSGYSKLAAGMSTTVGSIRCLTLVKCVTYTFKLYLYIFFPHPSNHFWSREYTLEAYFKCCQQDWFFAKTLAMDKWTRHENKLFKYNYQRLSAKDESSCFIKCLKRRWCSTKTDLRISTSLLFAQSHQDWSTRPGADRKHKSSICYGYYSVI